MPTEMELRRVAQQSLERVNRPAPIDPKWMGLGGQPGQVEDRRQAGLMEILNALYGTPVATMMSDLQTPFDVPERHRQSLLGPMPATTDEPMASVLGYSDIGRR